MHKRINRAFCNFLIEIFEFTEEQLAALDYQIPMTQEVYNSILDRCIELGKVADDLFCRLLNEYPEYLSVYDQKIEDEVSRKYGEVEIPKSSLKELRIRRKNSAREFMKNAKKIAKTDMMESILIKLLRMGRGISCWYATG